MLIVYITAWIASQGENNTLGSWLDRKWLLGSLLSLKFLYKQFHTSIHFMQLTNSDDQYPPNIGLLANLFSINVFLSQNLSIPFLLVSFYKLPIWVFYYYYYLRIRIFRLSGYSFECCRTSPHSSFLLFYLTLPFHHPNSNFIFNENRDHVIILLHVTFKCSVSKQMANTQNR